MNKPSDIVYKKLAEKQYRIGIKRAQCMPQVYQDHYSELESAAQAQLILDELAGTLSAAEAGCALNGGDWYEQYNK